jgi:hypothetical protein
MLTLLIPRSRPHRVRSFQLTISLIVLVLGCDTAPPPTPIPPPAPLGPEVPTPQFVHWAKFPIGTEAVREKVVTNANGSITVTTTQRLIRKDAQEVVVEQQSTVSRPDGKTEEPSQEFVFPATFRLPPNLKEEQFALPSFKAKLTGTEAVKIGDASYNADVYEWQEANETGPMTVKLWRDHSVPGQTLREELKIVSNGQTSIEELKRFVIPPQ